MKTEKQRIRKELARQIRWCRQRKRSSRLNHKFETARRYEGELDAFRTAAKIVGR